MKIVFLIFISFSFVFIFSTDINIKYFRPLTLHKQTTRIIEFISIAAIEVLESVMCDVIKTSKKRDCNEKWERKIATKY